MLVGILDISSPLYVAAGTLVGAWGKKGKLFGWSAGCTVLTSTKKTCVGSSWK
jgi:hypothetical protein